MQLVKSCRGLAVLLATGVLVNCSPVDNPYARIQNPPLVRAKLHTVTVVTPDAGIAQRIDAAGYEHTAFPDTNYPNFVPVEAQLWKVPEEVAITNVIFMAFLGHGPNVRLIFMMDVEPVEPVDDEVEAAFYRNVLGSDLPQWQGSQTLRNGARVQAYTFVVDDLLAARKRLREGGIPITVEPLAFTTAYLGTHQAMGIQAPDGTAIELVQSVAQ